MPKVLIIDDDQSMQSLYQRSFSLGGFEVAVAQGGNEGFEMAQTGKPDIILLDMMMPGVNGLEVLEKLKADAATKTIPVIVMSNYSEQNITNRATELGADQYFIKSDIDPTALVDIVRDMLSR